MLAREDFYRILQETVQDYFKNVRNHEIEFSYNSFENSERFRIYTLGGVICREKKPPGAKQFLLAEWNVRNNFIKNITVKGIVYYLLYTRKAGSVRPFFLTRGALGQNEIISPQNRSIRFFNYDDGTVDCVIKKGFTDKYFNNQIKFRKKYHYDFMVPIIDSGDCWFKEKILKGHPLVRVSNENQYHSGMTDAIKCISVLAKDTLYYSQANEYVGSLWERTQSLVKDALMKKNIMTFNQCNSLLSLIKLHTQTYSGCIPTCMSHGDFQAGNIWVNQKGKTLIYDWETSGRRSVWYDKVTLLYSLRKPEGWKLFIKSSSLCEKVVDFDSYYHSGNIPLPFIKAVILLEDLFFLLEDMLELPETWGNDIFDYKINRIYNLFCH